MNEPDQMQASKSATTVSSVQPPTQPQEERQSDFEHLFKDWMRLRFWKILTWGFSTIISAWFLFEAATHKSHVEIEVLDRKLNLLTNQSVQIDQLLQAVLDRSKEESLFAGDYNVAGGWIARFPVNSEQVIKTDSDEQFSLLSDSSHYGLSTVRYEVISKNLGVGDSAGFLRIHYQLQSTNAKMPFVGVYANFSNPPRMFDVSKYSGMTLSCRGTSSTAISATEVTLQLCDDTVRGNGNYAWKEFSLPFSRIQGTNFVDTPILFSQFKSPPWKPSDDKLNPKRLYRIVLTIKGLPDSRSEGTVDIEDVRFTQN